ncbi:MAG: SMR family transporter [Nocardioidaceae bacterium]
MKGWVFLTGAIILEVAATVSLKGALVLPWLYAIVAVGYLGAFVLISKVLSLGVSIGVAYGIWGASGVALTAVLSAIVFGESLTPTMVVGIALIIGGVLAVEVGSQRAKAEVH